MKTQYISQVPINVTYIYYLLLTTKQGFLLRLYIFFFNSFPVFFFKSILNIVSDFEENFLIQKNNMAKQKGESNSLWIQRRM